VALYNEFGFTDEVKKKILYKNAVRVLGL